MSIVAGIIAAALDEVERDPALRERIRAALGTAAPTSGPALPAYMKVTAYAERASLSVRTIRSLIGKGLPCVGAGRTRRIDVARADEWLRRRRDAVDDAVERDARQRARRAALRAMPGGKT